MTNLKRTCTLDKDCQSFASNDYILVYLNQGEEVVLLIIIYFEKSVSGQVKNSYLWQKEI